MAEGDRARRSEAARKAAATKGPEARREAARKAAEARRRRRETKTDAGETTGA